MGNTATRANNARRNLICPSKNTTDLPDDLSLECVHFQAKLIPMLIFLLLALALPLHGCRSPDENRAPQERPNALHHPAEVSPSTPSAAARLMDGMGNFDGCTRHFPPRVSNLTHTESGAACDFTELTRISRARRACQSPGVKGFHHSPRTP